MQPSDRSGRKARGMYVWSSEYGGRTSFMHLLLSSKHPSYSLSPSPPIWRPASVCWLRHAAIATRKSSRSCVAVAPRPCMSSDFLRFLACSFLALPPIAVTSGLWWQSSRCESFGRPHRARHPCWCARAVSTCGLHNVRICEYSILRQHCLHGTTGMVMVKY